MYQHQVVTTTPTAALTTRSQRLIAPVVGGSSPRNALSRLINFGHPARGAAGLRRRLDRWVLLVAVLPVLSLSACATADSGAGCADVSVKESLPSRAGPRGGVVRAHVQLTGRQTTINDHGAVSVYSELTIVDPDLVAGHDPHILTGWVRGGKTADGTAQVAREPEGALWGPDGAAVLVINPAKTLLDNPDKIELGVAPVVGDSVITSNAGCWGFSDLTSKPFSGMLSDVPGSETADSVRGSASASPYSDFAALAQESLSAR